MKIKSQSDLVSAIYKEFTESEIRNINPKIYLHPDHLDYWMAYKCEEYQKCWNYLLKNRNLLK